MNIELERFAYTPTETQGRLVLEDLEVWTIEQPWRPWHNPGGEPFRSCVPDGKYELVPFTRPNRDKTFALVNEVLGVFLEPRRDLFGRYLCLIHPGNYVSDVQGCVAPGRRRLIFGSRIMVTSSQATFREIMRRVPWRSGHTMTITPALGTLNGTF